MARNGIRNIDLEQECRVGGVKGAACGRGKNVKGVLGAQCLVEMDYRTLSTEHRLTFRPSSLPHCVECQQRVRVVVAQKNFVFIPSPFQWGAGALAGGFFDQSSQDQNLPCGSPDLFAAFLARQPDTIAPFRALPIEVRQAVYRRMWEILSGSDSAPRYGRLAESDRRAIVEIVRQTMTDWPSEFASSVAR